MASRDGPLPALTRRRFLILSAAATTVAACDLVDRPPVPSAASQTVAASVGASPTFARPTDPPTPSPTPSPEGSIAPSTGPARTLYRSGALADARSDRLEVGVSILVEGNVIRWIRPADAEEDPGPSSGLERVDASGATFVAGMVDAHSHITLPGGAHWLDRADDDPAELLQVAERNGRLLTSAGVRWARDVGAP